MFRLSVDDYRACFDAAMRRFSLISNSTLPVYRLLAERWLGKTDRQLARCFEMEPTTQGQQLFRLRWDTADSSGRLMADDWGPSFYGRLAYTDYGEPVRRRSWTWTVTEAFFAASHYGLHEPDEKDEQKGKEPSETVRLADCAVNYLVKNCAHELVHLVPQGVNHGNFRNFNGAARNGADMDADNLANIVLARAYGLGNYPLTVGTGTARLRALCQRGCLMEVRWMVLAMGSRLTAKGALDLDSIFEHYRIAGPPFPVAFQVLIKIVPDPLLASTETMVSLRISNQAAGYESVAEWPYAFPTWDEWLQGFTAFLRLPVDVLLESPGEYAVDLIEHDNIIASEGFELIEPREGTDAKFQGQTRSS